MVACSGEQSQTGGLHGFRGLGCGVQSRVQAGPKDLEVMTLGCESWGAGLLN